MTLVAALETAFDRIDDFLAVQAGELSMDAVLRLQESVGVDDDARAAFARRLSEVHPDAAPGAVLLGVLLGLSAAELSDRGRPPRP